MQSRRITLMRDNHSARVYIEGVELDPKPSQAIYNHSPDGFGWGYQGSGPAQLALALCFHYLGDGQVALKHHQAFKFQVVATWDYKIDTHELAEDEVLGWFFRHNLLYQCPCGFMGNPIDFQAHRQGCHHPLWDEE